MKEVAEDGRSNDWFGPGMDEAAASHIE